MPAGNISSKEKFQRLSTIQSLIDDGKTDPSDIAQETGLPVATVKRNIIYLQELRVADLTLEEIGQKRSELYIELMEVSDYAKTNYLKYENLNQPTNARGYLYAWMKAIEMKAKLFGISETKIESFTQINTQVNSVESEKVSPDAARKIADVIKKNHEIRVAGNGM